METKPWTVLHAARESFQRAYEQVERVDDSVSPRTLDRLSCITECAAGREQTLTIRVENSNGRRARISQNFES